MNVPHIILSAIAGVIIFAIVDYFVSRKLISKKHSTILFIVLIGLFQLVYVLGYAPQKKQQHFQQQFEVKLQQTHPIYQTIKQQDIETYNRLKDKIITLAKKMGEALSAIDGYHTSRNVGSDFTTYEICAKPKCY